jgi:hypothetical protein
MVGPRLCRPVRSASVHDTNRKTQCNTNLQLFFTPDIDFANQKPGLAQFAAHDKPDHFGPVHFVRIAPFIQCQRLNLGQSSARLVRAVSVFFTCFWAFHGVET